MRTRPLLSLIEYNLDPEDHASQEVSLQNPYHIPDFHLAFKRGMQRYVARPLTLQVIGSADERTQSVNRRIILANDCGQRVYLTGRNQRLFRLASEGITGHAFPEQRIFADVRRHEPVNFVYTFDFTGFISKAFMRVRMDVCDFLYRPLHAASMVKAIDETFPRASVIQLTSARSALLRARS